MKKIVKGTKEQRINRMTRMALEWQDDLRNNKTNIKNSSYYFRKYHIGPYKTELFSDILTANIDRNWVINKMNLCSAHKKLLKQSLEERRIAHKLTISQPSLFDEESTLINNGKENVITSNVEAVKAINRQIYGLSDYSDLELINELKNRDYKVLREY